MADSDAAGGTDVIVAPIAMVQKTPAGTPPMKCLALTCSVTLPSPTAAGDLVAAMVVIDANTPYSIMSVSDDAGGTGYTLAVASTIQVGGFGLAAIYYRENVPAAPLTVTVTANQMTYIALAVIEYSGLARSGALHATSMNMCTSGCGAVDAGELGDGELSLAVFTTNNLPVNAIVPGVGWTELANDPDPINAVIGAEHRIGASNSLATWSPMSPQPWVAIGAKFGP